MSDSLRQALEEYVKYCLNVVSEEATGCCGELRKALVKDPLLKSWDCPKCEMAWRPREVEGVRLWEARPMIEVWR